MQATIRKFVVEIDAKTGEWLGDPELDGSVSKSEWDAKEDTDLRHYDTFEHNGETCAIECVLIYE